MPGIPEGVEAATEGVKEIAELAIGGVASPTVTRCVC